MSGVGKARGRETKLFVEDERGLLPLRQRNDEGEGWGEEAISIGKPLSSFVPHGERESTSGKSICVVMVLSPEKPMKRSLLRILSHASARCGGFSLLEFIGVLAILAILAVMFVPSVIKSVDQGTINAELANVNTFSNALVLNILQNLTIPAPTNMAAAIAANLALPLSGITTNSRNYRRSFLVDPNLSINGAALPYTQTINGSTTVPSGARALIVSTLSQGNPPVAVATGVPSAANFNDIWNTTANQLPTNSIWSPWTKYKNDVVIQRINLQPLFYQLILINHDGPTNATFSINTTNTTTVTTNGTGWNSYYLSGSVVGLCDASNVPQTRYVLSRNISYVFQNGQWNGQTSYIGIPTSTNSASAFDTAATAFFGSAWNPGATSNGGKGADQSAVLCAMANFMADYTFWANVSTSPFFAHAPPGNNLPMNQLMQGEAGNVGTYSGTGNGNNSGLLHQ